MNINSCLNSASVKMTCEDYKAYMQSEIDAYKEIDSRISKFLSEEESSSESITGIKTQMGDYSLVLTTLWVANQDDITDANSLMNLVGDETLDGRLIFREQQEARDDESTCNGRAYSASVSARNATQPGEAERYEAEASYWRGQAWAANSRYNYWKKKEQRYDEINAASATLFTKSYSGRNMAYQLLALMRSSFSDGKYNISDDRQQLRDGCKDAILDGWNKDGQIDADKVFEDINNCENMNDIEYEAFIKYLNSIGIAVPQDCSRDNLKQIIQDTWVEGFQNLPLYDDNNNIIPSPFDSLTYEQRKLYVLLYEDKYPDDADQMSNISTIFENDGYLGWEEDLYNIKFLTYTAPEPYKSVYLQNVKKITTGQLSTKDWPHASGGSFCIIAEEWFKPPKKSSTYDVFFHETTHCIDYFLGQKQGTGSFTEYWGLKDYLEADVRGRINEKVNAWLSQGEYKYLSDDEKLFIMYVVEDCMMNQVDYELFQDPNFYLIASNSEFASRFHISNGADYTDYIRDCYKSVQSSINGELPSAVRDCYGGFTGNTVGGGHASLIRDKGGQYEKYRTYWITQGKFVDGTNGKKLQITMDPSLGWCFVETNFDSTARIDDSVIMSEYNLNYNNATASEILAIGMGSYMTRNSKADGLNYLYPETKEQFDSMIGAMYVH